MTTTTPGQTARTHPLDDAVSSYGIELNHAGNPSTDRPIRQLRSTSVRTNVPAMDADRTLISLMLAHSSETQLHSFLSGVTPRPASQRPVRPGSTPTGDLQGQGCQEIRRDRTERTAGRKRAARRGSEEKRNKEKGTGG